jgi:hypothetical protein
MTSKQALAYSNSIVNKVRYASSTLSTCDVLCLHGRRFSGLSCGGFRWMWSLRDKSEGWGPTFTAAFWFCHETYFVDA